VAYPIELGQRGRIAVENATPDDDSFSLDIRRSPSGSWLEGDWTPIRAGATGTLYTVEIRAEDGFEAGDYIDAKIMSAIHMREVWHEDGFWIVTGVPVPVPPPPTPPTPPTPVPPGMRQFLHRRTAEADTYRGPAQKATVTFRALPEQFDVINRWFFERYVSSMQSALEDRGAVLLETKAYRDTSPTWRTDYLLEVTAGVEAAAEQMAFAWLTPAIWLLIVQVAAAAIILLVSALVVSKLTNLVWGPGDGERPKPPLGIPWLGWLAFGGGVFVLYMAVKSGAPQYIRERYLARKEQ